MDSFRPISAGLDRIGTFMKGAAVQIKTFLKGPSGNSHSVQVNPPPDPKQAMLPSNAQAASKPILKAVRSSSDSGAAQKSDKTFKQEFSRGLEKLGKFIGQIKAKEPTVQAAAQDYIQTTSVEAKEVARLAKRRQLAEIKGKLGKMEEDFSKFSSQAVCLPQYPSRYQQISNDLKNILGLSGDLKKNVIDLDGKIRQFAFDLRKASENPDRFSKEQIAELENRRMVLNGRFRNLEAVTEDQLSNLPKLKDFQGPGRVAVKKNYISNAEAHVIQAFVKDHKAEWEHPDFKGMRYDKGKHFLPRTIDVVKDEQGKLYIMVLCKEKGEAKGIGKGSTRSVKEAIDWESGKAFVDIVVKENELGMKNFQNEKRLLEKLHQQQDIPVVEPLVGLHAYTHEGLRKMVGYMPLYEGGNLESLLAKGSITPHTKINFCRDLLKVLVALDKAEIEHRDLKEDNLYIDISNPERPRLRLADFELSREENQVARTPGTEEYAEKYNNTETVLNSPEKCMATNIYKDGKNRAQPTDSVEIKEAKQQKREAARQAMDQNWRHNNTWGVGLMMLGIIRNNTSAENKQNRQALELYNDVIKPMTVRNAEEKPVTQAEFDAAVQAKIKVFLEAARNEILNSNELNPLEQKQMLDLLDVTAQLLTVDPSQRILPQDALKQFQSLFPE